MSNYSLSLAFQICDNVLVANSKYPAFWQDPRPVRHQVVVKIIMAAQLRQLVRVFMAFVEQLSIAGKAIIDGIARYMNHSRI